MATVTVAAVNAHLKSLGYPERLRRGRGYYYFTEGNSFDWFQSGVYVNNVDALDLDGWVRERNALAADVR